MRRQLKKVDSHVYIHLLLGIYAQLLVGVNRDQKCPNVSLMERRKNNKVAYLQ